MLLSNNVFGGQNGIHDFFEPGEPSCIPLMELPYILIRLADDAAPLGTRSSEKQ